MFVEFLPQRGFIRKIISYIILKIQKDHNKNIQHLSDNKAISSYTDAFTHPTHSLTYWLTNWLIHFFSKLFNKLSLFTSNKINQLPCP
jgi:hypothetical protein